MSQPGLVFFGSPPLAAELLKKLVEEKFRVIAAVTQPDRPAGRAQALQPPAVKIAAEKLGVRVLQPANLIDAVATLQALQPVVGILFAYGRILPKSWLDVFPSGILNLHPSLLPRYRGPSPVSQAILDGVTETGVSVIRLDEQLDHGPIISQWACKIAPEETADALLSRLVRQGSGLLCDLLPQYLAGKIQPRPQDETLATYTRPVSREDGRIDWSDTAEAVYRKYRAYVPWPGVFTTWQNRRLKLLELSPIPSASQQPDGTVVGAGGRLVVACSQGAVSVGRLQLEGKSPVDDKDFLRGHPSFAGSRLG